MKLRDSFLWTMKNRSPILQFQFSKSVGAQSILQAEVHNNLNSQNLLLLKTHFPNYNIVLCNILDMG